MNKLDFLAALSDRLQQLPAEERKKHFAYYSELIEDMKEDGMTEEEAVAKLGSPQEIADSILQDQPLQELVKNRVRPKKGWTFLNVMLLILGAPLWLPLLIAFFAVILSVYIVIWTVIAVLFVVVLTIGITGLALFLSALFLIAHSFPLALLALGGAVLLAGLTIPAFIVAVYVAKLLILLTKAIGRWVRSLFVRKEA